MQLFRILPTNTNSIGSMAVSQTLIDRIKVIGIGEAFAFLVIDEFLPGFRLRISLFADLAAFQAVNNAIVFNGSAFGHILLPLFIIPQPSPFPHHRDHSSGCETKYIGEEKTIFATCDTLLGFSIDASCRIPESLFDVLCVFFVKVRTIISHSDCLI